MVKEAEVHADEDKKRRELVEANNQAESLLHATEKTLEEAGDKLDETDRTAVGEAIEALKSAVASEDTAEIRAKTEALTQASMKLGEALYKASMEEAAAGDGQDDGDRADDGAASDADAHDTVVDADFEEVDDDRKGKST